MNKIYYYDHRVYVVHMTFLSWGGSSMAEALNVGETTKSLQNMAIRSLRAIHQEGVIHKDIRLANMLFNRESNSVMMIDFERASLLEPPRLPLTQLVPNKRRRKPETIDRKNAADKSSHRVSRDFSEDIHMAKTVFRDCYIQ
ncbi:hypothetical protein V2G26_019904 [Clonostachys chloroleuca]